jgi:L-arabinose isomerase
LEKNKYNIWFVTGSQNLYGAETLKQVDIHAGKIVNSFDSHPKLPVHIIQKGVMKSPEEITKLCKEANNDNSCIGIIVWMHTFSPSKMWIQGLTLLSKPLLHLHTQYNEEIPYSEINMDFMNLNQSAHGDREFAHMLTRMQKQRKTVVGHWKDPYVIDRIDAWSRACIGFTTFKQTRVVRFGDNMRYVGVTEGNKVSAEIILGIEVNTHGVGDLVDKINKVDEADLSKLIQEYEDSYSISDALQVNGDKRSSLIEAAKIELGIKAMLEEGGYTAYTNTFEDLHGMLQLPGIGSQHLMAQGFGFGAEGDWKTSALLRVMKQMALGLKGGNSFMEDYTYHFEKGNNMVLGSHMLEICPSITTSKPSCEIHPLGIGGKADPVRLVFNGDPGPAINVSLIDLGHKLRLIANEVEAVQVNQLFPKLPTARVLWRPLPDMHTGLHAWLLAGGAHHSVYSQNLTVEHIEDLAEMLKIECIVIDKHTQLREFKRELYLLENIK